jgi:hypothetical protein
MSASVVTPVQPIKPGPPGSWEEIAADAVRMRQIVELVTRGRSYRQIAKDLGIAYTTVMRIAPKIADLINEDTRALAAMWQAREFLRLEGVSQRLLPDLIGINADKKPLDLKTADAYLKVVKAQFMVLTLNRQKVQFPEDAAAADDQAGEKARVVGRFMELADRLVEGIAVAGVGSGRAPEDDDDEDELDRLDVRADNSSTIDDAVPWDDGESDDLDAQLGEWRDGKFYATAS